MSDHNVPFEHSRTGFGRISSPNRMPEEHPSSPRSSQETVGIISWQNGSIPKIRIRMPNNTKQKIAKVINKTLPAFIISGLNEVNISGLSSGIANGLGSGSGALRPIHTGGFPNSFSSNEHPTIEVVTVPNSSHHSLCHARSTLSFDSSGSGLSRASQQIGYEALGGSGGPNSSMMTASTNGTPLTRYCSWSSAHSGIALSIGSTSLRVPSTAASLNMTPASHHFSAKLVSDRDSAISTTIGETESGIAFLGEEIQCLDSCDEDKSYDPVWYLPSEIILQVFRYLDIKSLNNCCLVSGKWRDAAESDSIWRYKYRSQCWESTTEVLASEMCWKSLYQTRSLLEKRWSEGKVTPKALSGHTDGVYCVHIDNEKIVTGSRDRKIKVWDSETGKLLLTLGNDSRANDLRHARSAPALSESLRTTEQLNALAGGLSHTGSVLCIALDAKLMVSGSSDSSCIIWQLPKFKPIKQVYRHSDGVLDVSLNDDYIISCSKDSTISIWDRHDANYALKYRLHGHRGPVNALHLRGDHIFSAGGDGLVKMWSISSGMWLRDFKGHAKGLACVQASEDGKHIVSGGSDNVIRVWDVETGECLYVLEGHEGLVRSLYILGNKIISGSYDQTIRVWDINTGKLITSLNGWHGSWIFSAKADCKRIVSTSFGTKPVILDFSDGLDRNYLKCIKK